MFIKKSFVDEIANSMERHLVDDVINKVAEKEGKLYKAADYLNAAAEIFDENGLTAQSELVTAVLESLAAKKSKKDKNKAKDKKKKVTKRAPKKKTLTSDKMVGNLKEKGWMFDESSNHDHDVDSNCAMCGDMSYNDDSQKKWWRVRRVETPYAAFDFESTEKEAIERKERREAHFGGEWELIGPFNSILEIEKKFHPHWFEDTALANDGPSNDSDEELYSMLDNFKKNTSEDFEDELDFDDFEDRVTIQDPFENYDKIYVNEDDPDDDFQSIFNLENKI